MYESTNRNIWTDQFFLLVIKIFGFSVIRLFKPIYCFVTCRARSKDSLVSKDLLIYFELLDVSNIDRLRCFVVE